MSSLDNFEDAIDALTREGVSFIVCIRRAVRNDGELMINYRIHGELHNPPSYDEWQAMATAVNGYCEDAMDGES